MPDQSRPLGIAIVLNVAIVALQLVFAVVAHSVGLFVDAGHNLGDVAAIAVSLAAVRLARRSPTTRRSYGFHRASVLAAQANAASILMVSVLIVFEAVRRLGTSTGTVDGPLVAIVAAVALVGNLAAAKVLAGTGHAHAAHAHVAQAHGGHDHGPDHDHGEHAHDEGEPAPAPVLDHNIRGAMLHLVSDAAASAAVLVAGLVIWVKGGWYWLDPVLSIVISVVIAWHGIKLLRDTADVVLQTVPDRLDAVTVRADLAAIPGVVDVHDLHIWALTSNLDVATAHVMIGRDVDSHRVLDAAHDVLSRKHRIVHATLQVEPDDHSGCDQVDW